MCVCFIISSESQYRLEGRPEVLLTHEAGGGWVHVFMPVSFSPGAILPSFKRTPSKLILKYQARFEYLHRLLAAQIHPLVWN